MIRAGSMCTGYGGLDLAVEDALGPVSLEWVADPDPGASRILTHRFPDAPNHGDIRAFPWETAAPVDVLTAGFPCQPVSVAGRGEGEEDERWLFDDICTDIGRMVTPPRLLVLENVAGLLSNRGGRTMARVVRGLAHLGYVGTYRTLRASDVGAPHRRDRVFILAWLTDANPAHLGHQRGRGTRDGRVGPAHSGHAPTNAASLGHRNTRASSLGGIPAATVGSSPARLTASHTNSAGQPRIQQGTQNRDGHPQLWDNAERRGQGTWGRHGSAIARWERIIGRTAPVHTEPGGTGPRLSPRFVEWMMGLPEGHVTASTIGLTRTQQLKALGNGVVPQQGSAAIRFLLPRLTTEYPCDLTA